jgi:histidine ammonia-lyase/phenylalanine ammonia-lyase
VSNFEIDMRELTLAQLTEFMLDRKKIKSVSVHPQCLERTKNSQQHLYKLMERRLPIYGVTTGYGDSCFRFVDPKNSEKLQSNLVSYLLVGSGPLLPLEACRATLLIRLKSLSRGYSGVSPELLERMALYLTNDWIPVIPCEGSLGASGDLIPLAYIAECIQGNGQVHVDGKIVSTADVLREAGVEPYVLKAKEGLALVNGTSAMAGLFAYNLALGKSLLEMATAATAWLCMALQGRTEPFEALVNDKAGRHNGQSLVAKKILKLLQDEKYHRDPLDKMKIEDAMTMGQVQDRYSLRCAPQILGPVHETIQLLEQWLHAEINSTSDNPLVDEDGSLGMGGNFYGGYLSQGMDYLKISLAQIGDMLDRQLATLIDEKANRGLPPNLANWPGLPKEENHLHHGLKGLHQSVSAITSEIMAKSIPNSVFSRSSESHNQDKVSLGMSAAVQCAQLNEQLLTVVSLCMICYTQALDLRKVELHGQESRNLYESIRATVPFVTHDQALAKPLQALREVLREYDR